MTDTWRGTYATRYVDRVSLHQPPKPVVYRRLTDEEIAALPERVRSIALTSRSMNDAMSSLGAGLRAAFVPRALLTPDEEPTDG